MAKPTNKGPKKSKSSEAIRSRRNRGKKQGLTANVKISLALVGVVVATIIGVLLLGSGDDSASTGTRAEQLVRPDSQKLSTGSTDDVLVEFLDFECEACRAAHPVVEQLRTEYGDQMTFVVRYMPLHASSINAAKAAESAAAQGKFEAMYDKLFETQSEWGEQQTPERARFFEYADDLGLDMTAFEKVFSDPATEAKIRRDEADGKALGVEGTPTFFLNGEQITLTSADDLRTQVAQALAE